MSVEIAQPRKHRTRYGADQICLIESCGRKPHGNGWCRMHWDRWRATGNPLGLRKHSPVRKYAVDEVCEIDGCLKPRKARTYCLSHYQSLKKYGDPNIARWRVNQQGKKEWHTAHSGYVVRYEPGNPNAIKNGYVYQHRQMMADHIGLPLADGENVHHKNGNRADNRIENLELWISGQPAGQRVQDLVAWARELLAQYGDLVDRML